MNPDLFGMFAPQGDPFALGSLFGMAGQDPEKAIPLLAQMGVEPPSKDQLFRPQENFFADSNGNQSPWQGTGGDRPNVPTGRDMRNLSRAPTDGNLSSYEDTFGTHWLPQGSPAETRKEAAPYLANQPEGQVPLPRPRPNNLQEQDEPDQRGAIDENDSYLTGQRDASGMQFSSSNRPPEDPLAALRNPQNKAIFDAEIKNQNPLQQLNMTPPGAPPAPNPMAAVAPQAQVPADQPFGDVFAAPTPPPAAPGNSYPQTWDGPMPKSRDLAIVGRMEGGRNGYGTVVDAGKGREALGQYGILNTNLDQWGRDVVGRPVTREEFLADPQLQDKIAQAKLGDLRGKYGPGGMARAWLAGEGGMNTTRTDAFGTTPAAHEATYNKFAADLGTQAPTRSTDISGARKPVLPDEAPAQAPAAAKAKTLADMLKGVAAPTTPSVIMPSGHAPLPSAGKGVEMNGAISQALAALAMGKKDPVSMLRLQQALGGR